MLETQWLISGLSSSTTWLMEVKARTAFVIYEDYSTVKVSWVPQSGLITGLAGCLAGFASLALKFAIIHKHLLLPQVLSLYTPSLILMRKRHSLSSANPPTSSELQTCSKAQIELNSTHDSLLCGSVLQREGS